MRTPDEYAHEGRRVAGLVVLALALVSAFLGGRACGLDAADRPVLAPAFR